MVIKKLLSRIKTKTVCISVLIFGALLLLGFIVKQKAGCFASGAESALSDTRGEGFVDTAIKILMAVVIGALVLGGLYLLFSGTVLPTLTERVTEMFNYGA